METTTSILKTVRQNIGPSEGYEAFDPQLILLINSALANLTQMGVGDPFLITSETEKWTDYCDIDKEHYPFIIDYVCSYVKLHFDAPTTSALTDVLKEHIKELEWRAYVSADY